MVGDYPILHDSGKIISVPCGPSERAPMMSLDNDSTMKVLVRNLLSAILSAEKIVRREHIKADRIERVNHFITCLRRELCGEQKSLIEGICRKDIWYDIGVISPNSLNSLNSWIISAPHLEQALLNAKRLRGNMEDKKSEIEHDLKELGSSIHGMDSLVSDMKRLNDESEGVLSKLSQLFPAPV